MPLVRSKPRNSSCEGIRGVLESLKMFFLCFKRVIGDGTRLSLK